MKIDLIIQGQTSSYTQEIVDLYRTIPWVGKIIISCWNGDTEIFADNVITIRSFPISNNGIGNRNAQITTSSAGIKEASSEFCAKLRSDQKISIKSMELMKNFMLKHSDKICVMGFYKAFPFHPRDHSFWGKTENVAEVFDIPIDPITSTILPHDAWPEAGFYSQHFRSECYIASHFLAKKEPSVKHMVDNPSTFIYDHAPRLQEAQDLNDQIMPKYFIPFPKINFEWPKHGLSNYHYDLAERIFGEFWTKEDN